MRGAALRIKEVRIRDLYRFACEAARGSARGPLPIPERRALTKIDKPYAEGREVGLATGYAGERFACEVARGSPLGLLPITKQRALAQTKNPYADGREVGLVAAYVGERCVGFGGMLPGLLKHGSRLIKISWGSGIFVDPRYRQNMLGLRLMTRWDSLFLGTIAPRVEAMAALGGQQLRPMTYHRIQGAPRAPNARAAREAQRTQRRLFEGIEVRAVPGIDEAETRERYDADATVFYRDHRAINWMLRFPWVREIGPGKPRTRYVFSDARDVFRYEALRVFSARSGAYKGFLVLSVSSSGTPRYTVLKLLDFHFPDRGDKRFLLPIVYDKARDCQAHAVEISQGAGRSLPGSMLALRDVRTLRCSVYFTSNGAPFPIPLKSIRSDYCDGDAPFT